MDSDIICYQQALKCQRTIEGFFEEPLYEQTQDTKFLFRELDSFIKHILNKTEADKPIVCLSDSHNFRYNILPTYKGNRSELVKPILLAEAREYLEKNYKCYLKPNLEGDDVMGILSTHGELLQGKRIICTTDKDLYQIAGYIYNWNKPDRGVEEITHEQGELWHMVQTLTGDVADGYEGLYRVGEVKAYKMLLERYDDQSLWDVVVSAYEEHGLTEEDALCIARVARMCTYKDYDFVNKEVILWNPS